PPPPPRRGSASREQREGTGDARSAEQRASGAPPLDSRTGSREQFASGGGEHQYDQGGYAEGGGGAVYAEGDANRGSQPGTAGSVPNRPSTREGQSRSMQNPRIATTSTNAVAER
ncbi:hypothetical protein TeGR_g12527, partial [Tetraparma gracilis]